MSELKTLKDFVEEYCSGPPELVPDDRRPRKELLEDFEKDLRAWAINHVKELRRESEIINEPTQYCKNNWIEEWIMESFNLTEKDLK